MVGTGKSFETSLDESSQDVSTLYKNYFNSGKAKAIDNAAKSKATEYYGLMWYLEGHKRYRFLLGKETVRLSLLPDESELKEITAALYVVASFEKNYDTVKAWTDFFFKAIPQAGYAPVNKHGFFFKDYPDGVNSNYELWTTVVKADV